MSYLAYTPHYGELLQRVRGKVQEKFATWATADGVCVGAVCNIREKETVRITYNNRKVRANNAYSIKRQETRVTSEQENRHYIFLRIRTSSLTPPPPPRSCMARAGSVRREVNFLRHVEMHYCYPPFLEK